MTIVFIFVWPILTSIPFGGWYQDTEEIYHNNTDFKIELQWNLCNPTPEYSDIL